MKALDLTGQRFGKLVALDRAPKRNDKYTRWICQCDCGNITEVRTDFLRNGHTGSCGCDKAIHFKTYDLKGKKFGKLTVLERVPPGSQKCLCECGNIVIVQTDNLMDGNTQSCGCLKSKAELKINELLTQMNIHFISQYKISDCIFPDSGKSASFDYAIFDNNNKLICLIEYDGEQHEVGWQHRKDSLAIIQKRDAYKNEYCKTHNIKLVRISYKEFDNLNINYLEGIIKETETAPDMEEAQDEV